MTQYAATLLASADESNSSRAQKQIRTLRKTELDSLAKGAGGGAGGNYRRAGDIYERSGGSGDGQQQCDEENAALQINGELARQYALLCNMLHNEQ